MLRTMLFSALIASASHAMSATLIEVKTDELPPNAFTVPADYQVQDTGQISPEAMQQLRQMQQR